MKQLFVNIHTFRKMLMQLMAVLDKKQRRQCVALFVGVFFASTLETLGVSAVIPFALVLFSPDGIMENGIIRTISDILGITTYLQLVIATALLVVVVYVLKNLALLLYQYYQGKFHNRLEKDLTVMMFHSYMERPYSYFLKTNTAEMLRGVSGDITNVAQVLDGFCGLFAEVITCLMIGVFLICMDPLMAMGLVGIALVVALIMILGFKRKTSYIGAECREAFAQKNQVALQAMSGYKEIFVNDKRAYFNAAYEKVNEKARKLNTSYLFIQKLPGRVIETIFISSLLLLSCVRIAQGGDTGEFAMVLSTLAVAAVRILPSITNITNYMNLLVYNRVGMEAAYENIMYVRGEEAQRQTSTPLATGQDGAKCDIALQVEGSMGIGAVCEQATFEHNLRVDGVEFQYESAEHKVLDGIDFQVRKGESIGIIGESGAGKSTLLDVLLGLWIPQKGHVLVDGKDLREMKSQWAQLIGYVPQSVFLLDDSIRRNIAFGIEDDRIDDARVWETLQEARLDDFVRSLPEGLDTVVGERGVRFSGGQRQRVAIARALYHNPQILILDEATSALDNETEKTVMEAIEQLQGKLTLIIVAHRLVTIENCDRVLRVEKGKIIETGK